MPSELCILADRVRDGSVLVAFLIRLLANDF